MDITVTKDDLKAVIGIEEVDAASLYTIYYSEDPTVDGYTQLDTTTSTSYTTSDLTEGYVYFFRVTYTDGDGNESQPSAARSIHITQYDEEGLYKVCSLVKTELSTEFSSSKIIISKNIPATINKDYIIWIQPNDGETEEPVSNYQREASYPVGIYVLKGTIGLSESRAAQTLIDDAETIKTVLRDNTLGGYVNTSQITDVVGPSNFQAGNVAVMGIRVDGLFTRRIYRKNAPGYGVSVYDRGCIYG